MSYKTIAKVNPNSISGGVRIDVYISKKQLEEINKIHGKWDSSIFEINLKDIRLA